MSWDGRDPAGLMGAFVSADHGPKAIKKFWILPDDVGTDGRTKEEHHQPDDDRRHELSRFSRFGRSRNVRFHTAWR